jgi:P-type Ca2+ transporter type 2C
VRLALDAGLDVPALRREFPLIKVNHRSETRLYMGTLHQRDSQVRFLALKGSPMDILALCRRQLRGGRETPLTEDDRAAIEMQNEDMAGRALRILGIAYAQGENGDALDENGGLTWVGMMGMTDPIREGVAQAIQEFHRAGIDTVMITGDQSTTAYAIGEELQPQPGRAPGNPGRLLSGPDRAGDPPGPGQTGQGLFPGEPGPQAPDRPGPAADRQGGGHDRRRHQRRPGAQGRGRGHRHGRTGTDVAREVADVVLEKDNLDTLIIAIRDGRTIYLNIRKSVHFFLATNLSEIMITWSRPCVGLGSPLNAMQLLWINLISDIFPGLALALEPPEPDILERPPRDPQAPIFDAADYRRMAFRVRGPDRRGHGGLRLRHLALRPGGSGRHPGLPHPHHRTACCTPSVAARTSSRAAEDDTDLEAAAISQ